MREYNLGSKISMPSNHRKHPTASYSSGQLNMSGSSQESGSPFNRGMQHEAKHSAILSRAAKLFNTKGARATTLSDVALKLGLTKTSLYYYVKTKEDLIYQCYEAALRQAHTALDRVEEETDVPLERVIKFMQAHVQTILNALNGDGDYYAAPLELASLSEAHQSVLRDDYLRMFKRVRGYVRAGIEDGSIRNNHSTSTTRALIGALDWSFYWLYEMPREDALKAPEAIHFLFKNGLFSEQCAYSPAANPITPDTAAPARGFDREAQNRLKQEAFFKAGTRFFNRKGFTGTSLDEIAEYLEVSKGAFYYHFANKEALLTQCYEYSIDQLDAIFEEVDVGQGSPAARLDTACRRIFSVQNSEQGPLIRYNTITALPPTIRRKILARTEANNDSIGRLVSAGIDSGEFRPVNVLVTQNLLLGAINASMDIGIWRKMDDVDATAVDYLDVFYHGLASR